MRKLNVAGVSALLALAAVLGTVAATRSVALGTTQKQASDAAVGARTKRLDALERSLRTALAQRTPALPRVPKAPAATQLATASEAARAAAAAPQRSPVKVVYRRPAPVVVTVHHSHGEDGESEPGEHGGRGDEGGDD